MFEFATMFVQLANSMTSPALDRELSRIRVDFYDGISGVRVRRHWRPSRVSFDDGPLHWDGPLEEALRLLRAVPSVAMNDGLWRALCPQQLEAYHRELDEWFAARERIEGELRRVDAVGVDNYGGVGFRLLDAPAPGTPRPCRLYERRVTKVDLGPNTRQLEVRHWTGTVEDALARLSPLPDGAGIVACWQAFAPSVAAEPRIALEERRRREKRALEAELHRLDADRPTSGRSVSFESALGTPHRPVHWVAFDEKWDPRQLRGRGKCWEGRAADALERLRTLPDEAGPGEVTEALRG